MPSFSDVKMLTEEWILILIGFLILALLATVGVMLVMSGLLKKIEVKTTTEHPLKDGGVVAYKTYKGDYSKAGDAFSWACKCAPFSSTMGIYYDNPAETAKEELRYAVCVFIEATERMAKEVLIQRLEEDNYKFFTLPSCDESSCEQPTLEERKKIAAVQCKFPFVNTLSILIAVRRVYPAMHLYTKERKLEGYPYIEVYRDGQITFLAMLQNQMRFYVPEYHSENEKFSSAKFAELEKANDDD